MRRDGTKVQNMVCPDCVRMHGRPHAAGCPRRIYPGAVPESADYRNGWKAAQRHFEGLAVSAVESETKRLRQENEQMKALLNALPERRTSHQLN